MLCWSFVCRFSSMIHGTEIQLNFQNSSTEHDSIHELWIYAGKPWLSIQQVVSVLKFPSDCSKWANNHGNRCKKCWIITHSILRKHKTFPLIKISCRHKADKNWDELLIYGRALKPWFKKLSQRHVMKKTNVEIRRKDYPVATWGRLQIEVGAERRQVLLR